MIAWQGNSEDISRYPKNTKIIEDSRQVKCFSNLTGNISFLLKCPFSLIQKKAIKDLIAIMRIDSTGSAGRMGQPGNDLGIGIGIAGKIVNLLPSPGHPDSCMAVDYHPRISRSCCNKMTRHLNE